MNTLKLLVLVFGLTAQTFFTFSQEISRKRDVEVSIELESGILYGSLLVPKGKKPKPVVLLIPGSGPTDRNCNSSLGLTSNSFLLLAEALYDKGIATLRIDKRTSGKSFSTFKNSLDTLKFINFVEDACLWVDYLKSDERFSEVFIAGHSKGALVGTLAALRSGPDGFISIAGAGRPIGAILYDQLKPSLKFDDSSDSLKLFIDSLEMGTYMSEAPSALAQLFPIEISKFMAEWMSYDPCAELKKYEGKVGIIAGGHDLQIPVSDAELLHQSKPKAKYFLFEEMNHVLKDAPLDRFQNFAVYNQPNKPITEGLASAIQEIVLSEN
jgi:uncharacterized protein